jgi:hypothetical protein
MQFVTDTPKLDAAEKHFRIPGIVDGMQLFLRYLPARVSPDGGQKVVL